MQDCWKNNSKYIWTTVYDLWSYSFLTAIFLCYFTLVTLVSFFSPTYLAGFQKADLFSLSLYHLEIAFWYFRVIIFMKYHIIRTIKCISTAFRVQFFF